MVLFLDLNGKNIVTNRFIVDITKEIWKKKKISHLQEFIKNAKKNAFEKIDACELNIWKVAIHVKVPREALRKRLKLFLLMNIINILVQFIGEQPDTLLESLSRFRTAFRTWASNESRDLTLKWHANVAEKSIANVMNNGGMSTLQKNQLQCYESHLSTPAKRGRPPKKDSKKSDVDIAL
ncbi:114_t:CDS:2 [Funneliformis mosseae]|uniref:114_t:CDS:1 n=1 Tax=Funneliformis mosseae TaxID=27381 RepID=A0A9N9AU24_FUNMO|nr:114_t:CDS:2 [Funneliformis mosseae]